MITLPELAAGALGSFLASDMKDRFGSSHARLAELIPFAAPARCIISISWIDQDGGLLMREYHKAKRRYKDVTEVSGFLSYWVALQPGNGGRFQLRLLPCPLQADNPYAKAVNNHGDGFEDLYGVRNFREVLKGFLFRGGANNAYNEHGRRNTKYPLPKNGLDNLCEEDSKLSSTFYPTNYDKAPKDLRCRSNAWIEPYELPTNQDLQGACAVRNDFCGNQRF